MTSRTPLIYLAVVIVAVIGGFFVYEGFLKEQDTGETQTEVTTPSEEEPGSSEFTPPPGARQENFTGDMPMMPDGFNETLGAFMPGLFNDTLGVSGIFRDLLMGLSTIADEEGTSEDALGLVTEMEGRLSEAVEGQELDEEQTALVDSLTEMMDEVRELAEEGASPADILETVMPQRRPPNPDPS